MSDLPHATDTSPDWLFAEIDRSFGSMEDFRCALRSLSADARHGGSVDLICTAEGALRLLPGASVHSCVLMRVPRGDHAGEAVLPLRALAARYARHMQNRPPCPMP